MNATATRTSPKPATETLYRCDADCQDMRCPDGCCGEYLVAVKSPRTGVLLTARAWALPAETLLRLERARAKSTADFVKFEFTLAELNRLVQYKLEGGL